MVGRFNGRISEVLATTRFDAAQRLEDTLGRYVRLYNHHIPQRALGHIAPAQALQDWQEKRPALFIKKVYNLTGLDMLTGPTWFGTNLNYCPVFGSTLLVTYRLAPPDTELAQSDVTEHRPGPV